MDNKLLETDIFEYGIKQEPEIDLNLDDPLAKQLSVAEENPEPVESRVNNYGNFEDMTLVRTHFSTHPLDMEEKSTSHKHDQDLHDNFILGMKQEPELDLDADELPSTEGDEAWGEQCEFLDAPAEEYSEDTGVPPQEVEQESEPLAAPKFKIIYLADNVNRVHKCVHCHREFASPGDLENHLRLFKETVFQCPHCPEKFQHRCLLKLHIQTHGGFKCPDCPREFQHQIDLTNHAKVHMDVGYKCPYCSREILRQHNFVKHLMMHSGDHPFKCQHCPKMFVSAQNLNVHLKIHMGQHTQKNAPVNHVSTPTEERPFQCSMCEKRFKKVVTLKCHERTHNTGPPTFECPHCPKLFAQKEYLRCHVRTHSPGAFKCTQCDKTFMKNSYLQRHMNSHLKNSRKLPS